MQHLPRSFVFPYFSRSLERGRDLNPRPTSAHRQQATELCRCAPPLYYVLFPSVQEDEENPDVRDGGDWEHAGPGPGGRRLQHSGQSIVVSRGGILNHLSPELGFTNFRVSPELGYKNFRLSPELGCTTVRVCLLSRAGIHKCPLVFSDRIHKCPVVCIGVFTIVCCLPK